jgi:type VI secretion system protein ImpA
MNELIENLLQPVSAEQPCGPDLSYDPRFDELETLLKGQPEVEIGAIKKEAEPPDWRELKDKCVGFLGQSKHLRVAEMLCCSLLKTGGLAGFRDGLQLMRGLLEQYWATAYPLLDPDDNNDPTQRINILRGFTTERGSYGAGWLAMLDYLYAAPICHPKGASPVSFDLLTASKKKAAGGEGAPTDAPDLAKLTAAFRDGAGEQVATSYQTVQESLEALRGIDQFLTTTLGASNTISFETLEKALQEMLGGLQPYISVADGQAAAADEGQAQGTAGGAGPNEGPGGIPVSGSIRSREDVVRVLDSICDYYRQIEPGSPVPYLLKRARKLALMDFVQAMQELNLANIDALRPSMGSGVDEAVPPAT